MDNDKLYVKHIVDAIGKVRQYTDGIKLEDFRKDTLVQDAVVRELEIIGEAARHISEPTKKKYGDILWVQILGMRNKLIHEYFGVDIDVVWETIAQDLQILREKLEKH